MYINARSMGNKQDKLKVKVCKQNYDSAGVAKSVITLVTGTSTSLLEGLIREEKDVILHYMSEMFVFTQIHVFG